MTAQSLRAKCPLLFKSVRSLLVLFTKSNPLPATKVAPLDRVNDSPGTPAMRAATSTKANGAQPILVVFDASASPKLACSD